MAISNISDKNFYLGVVITLKVLIFCLRILPQRSALLVGRVLGRILRLILWKKTDLCEARCVKSLGVGVTSARDIIKQSFMNLGMSVVEFVRFPQMKKHINGYITFSEDSKALLREALSRGHGAILMTSHMANWELAAMCVIEAGFPLSAVYTPQHNQGGVNDLIMKIRTQTIGMTMIDSEGGGLREIFKVLKSGGIVVIMQDLDARRDGVMSEFLGLPASTHEGIVKLYRKFKCPVVPVRYIRDENNPSHHELTMPEILSDRLDSEGRPFGEDIDASLRMCNEVIERWVKETPGQWLWLLDRWQYTLGKKI